MLKKVTKAVIPVAGFGTRFLPQTKAMPKQMLPIVDKPVIQYIVESLVKSGITEIIMVTNYHERAIEDHFDRPHQDLIENILMGGEKKRPYIDVLRDISDMANFVYVRQKGPYGNGTPLLNVRHLINQEPFIYTWGDEFIETLKGDNIFTQLIDTHAEFGCSVLGSIKARTDEDYKRFGFSGGSEIRPGLIDVKSIVEKPGKDKAPSNLANLAGYLFTPEIFEYMDKAQKILENGNELWYNDGLRLMIADGVKIVAKQIEGGVYRDAGTKIEYMKTVVEMGMKHPEIGKEFKEFLADLKV